MTTQVVNAGQNHLVSGDPPSAFQLYLIVGEIREESEEVQLSTSAGLPLVEAAAFHSCGGEVNHGNSSFKATVATSPA